MVRLIVVSVLCFPTLAWAQSGTVNVRVQDSQGRPLDGTVTFRARNAVRTCRTVASRCSLTLDEGTWTAELRPVREHWVGTQRVAVRRGSTASVVMRTRASSATTQMNASVMVVTTGTTAMVASRPASSMTRPVVRATQVQRTQVRASQVRPNSTRVNRVQASRVQPSQVQPNATQAHRTVAVQTPSQMATVTTAAMVATRNTSSRNLSRGNRLCVQGSIVDTAGRPTDAQITVRQNNRVVGTATSVAGRFSMFDLPPGRYELHSRSARTGANVRQTLTLGNGVSRVTVRIR